MSAGNLKQKIREALKHNYFKDPDDAVYVLDGPADSLHLVIVSPKFNNRHMKDKNDLIWKVLRKELLPQEWGKVSLSIGTSPEEIAAT